MIRYAVFIKTNTDGRVISARCPDLNITFDIAAMDRTPFQQCQELLLNHFMQLEQENAVITAASDPTELLQEPDEFLCLVSVDYSLKKFIFERNAPWFGYGARIVTAISFSLTTFLAISIVNKSKESRDSAYVAAILGFVMTIVIYTFSQAPTFLSGSFRRVDDSLFRKASKNDVRSSLVNRKDILKCLVYGLSIAIGLGDVTATSIVRFQSTVSLGNESTNKPEWLSEKFIYFVALLLAVSHFSTDVVFESAFTVSAAKSLFRLFSVKDQINIENGGRQYELVDHEANPLGDGLVLLDRDPAKLTTTYT